MQLNDIHWDSLESGSERFSLQHLISSGAFAQYYQAIDNASSTADRKVCIKVLKLKEKRVKYIERDYKVWRDLSHHQCLPDFYGIFKGRHDLELWLAIELMDGGNAQLLVTGLIENNRRLSEEHIALILKDVTKALIFLHSNNVMHRNIRAANILFPRSGDIKIGDFNVCCCDSEKSGTCIGSPNWMAPEVISGISYDNRCDIWSLGITAIELAEGKTPYTSNHASQAIFQIVRNPPPTLSKMSNWSNVFNDFVSEVLIKNPLFRPYAAEVIEHPLFDQVPENNYYMYQELRALYERYVGCSNDKPQGVPTPLPLSDCVIHEQTVQTEFESESHRLIVEDLAALRCRISEDTVFREIRDRFQSGQYYTFLGDILLALNPNQQLLDRHSDGGGQQHHMHESYTLKCRSDNPPHIYAMADAAYQNALHHAVVQQIVLTGESGSGKTTNYLHLIDHFIHLGRNYTINLERIRQSVDVIHALVSAETRINGSSTRAVIDTELTFNATGRLNSANFQVFLLDKWRLYSTDISQGNFHIFYYLYDWMQTNNKLYTYKLKPDVQYRAIRRQDTTSDFEDNVKSAKSFFATLEALEFDNIPTVLRIFAAIVLIGELTVSETDGHVNIEGVDNVYSIAELLEVDEKKFSWALKNYCEMQDGSVVRRRYSVQETERAIKLFGQTLYSRFVDLIVSALNDTLMSGRKFFGHKYSIKILDYAGFECQKRNSFSQLLINCLNEQLHYHYLQNIFNWEFMDLLSENLPQPSVQFYNNKETLDHILGKTGSVFSYIDEATRFGHEITHIIDNIGRMQTHFVSILNYNHFSVAHYMGRITYSVRDMSQHNVACIPAELNDCMRLSKNHTISQLFTKSLNKFGSVMLNFDDYKESKQYGQNNDKRSTISTFRALSLSTLRELSSGRSGTHFVRCVRTNLKNQPKTIQDALVKQQLRGLVVVQTVKMRQCGFSYRTTFSEFLHRYKFLAFDFDETVDTNMDNCKLLIIRLNLEDYAIGRTKVFLKYFHEEFLARLYEKQVKKVIKIQTIARRFLVKCKLSQKHQNQSQKRDRPLQPASNAKAEIVPSSSLSSENDDEMFSPAESANLQDDVKLDNGVEKETNDEEEYADPASTVAETTNDEPAADCDGPQPSEAHKKKVTTAAAAVAFKMPADVIVGQDAHLDEKSFRLLEKFASRWRKNSIIRVLTQYRALQYRELYNFCQQAHLYNQHIYFYLENCNSTVGLADIDRCADVRSWLGDPKPAVLRKPFYLSEFVFYDTSSMMHSSFGRDALETPQQWDQPYHWRMVLHSPSIDEDSLTSPIQEPLIHHPYQRDPDAPVVDVPSDHTNIAPLSTTRSPCHSMSSKATKNGCKAATYSGTTNTAILNVSQARTQISPASVMAKIPNVVGLDPISELKNRLNRDANGTAANDDIDAPPYDFKSMLRKTNYTELIENKQRFPIQELKVSNNEGQIMNLRKMAATGQRRPDVPPKLACKHISMDLRPGVHIEGFEVEV